VSNIVVHVGLGLVGIGLFLGVWVLAQNESTEAPELGTRGLRRQQALDSSPLFRMIEPIMRFVAGMISTIPLTKVRQRAEDQLQRASYCLGLTADEYLALSIISALGCGAAGFFAVRFAGTTPLSIPFLFALGTLLPSMRVNSEVNRRFKEVNRSLPAAIDLASLCMGAGLDFPGALRQIVFKTRAGDDTLQDELRQILQELELGRTRREALIGFAERVPTEAVKDFVGAVIQAEEKGNPLSEILRIQAGMLRMRRSIKAEEAAAKAAVMMMAPLMLIFGSILLILLGPFIVNNMNSGF
jgi:tight adherence protein C